MGWEALSLITSTCILHSKTKDGYLFTLLLPPSSQLPTPWEQEAYFHTQDLLKFICFKEER